ncbi:hypothetical protein ACQEUX_05495 [Micromonospora sp. CA-259024]|uniref:hypothetical protein n=1 Tax=Micromonospora sp. CA-259024 TaxID=3239965 RepID=UPI003D8E465C
MTGRRTRRAFLAGAMLLTLLATGCGVRPSGVITGRPAVSGPSRGIGLYLLSQGELTLVLRPSKADAPPAETLVLLAAGLDESERSQGFTSEVPVDVAPVMVTPGADRSGGLTVRTTSAARSLSANAADQIICTVADAAARIGLATTFAEVTIVGPDGARKPRPCPIR